MLSGVFAAWGGATLSLMLSSSFSRNMVSGRGFMALAALIFGAWRPRGVIVACLFFAWVEAMQIRLQGVVLWGVESVPVQFIQILPYIVTLGVLAFRSQTRTSESRAPRSLGLPF